MDTLQTWLQLRMNLNEEVEAHWKDLELLRRIQFEYKRIWTQLAMQTQEWVAASASVTVTESVITLPSDCGKPLYLEDDQGYRVPLGVRVSEKNLFGYPQTSFDMYDKEAYPLGNTLVLTQTGVSGTYTLYYQKRYVEPHCGVAGANSGASALHLEGTNQPSLTDDFYNNLGVRTYDSSTYAPKLDTTITDYVGSTLIATVTGTPASGDLYGTVLELPEEADSLLLARCTLASLAKPAAALDPKYFQYHSTLARHIEEEWRGWITTRIQGERHVRIVENSDG